MTRFRKKTFMEDRRSVRLRRFFWLLGIALLFPQKQMHQTHEAVSYTHLTLPTNSRV